MSKSDNLRFELDSLYMVAMMKIQQELNRVKTDRLDDLLEASLTELGIERRDFDRYLSRNRENLIRVAEAVGI